MVFVTYEVMDTEVRLERYLGILRFISVYSRRYDIYSKYAVFTGRGVLVVLVGTDSEGYKGLRISIETG